MKKCCPDCKLVNFAAAAECARCRRDLLEVSTFDIHERTPRKPSFAIVVVRRAAVCVFMIAFTLFGFYLSLIGSAEQLHVNEKASIKRSIEIIDDGGFRSETFLLRYLTAYRATDNWLNASVEKENAYAAANFPFEILTIYPDCFNLTRDEVERAAILLHEAQHLKGADEKEAYAFVWKNRKRIGWTSDKYSGSVVWRNIRKQTREIAPELFVCPENDFSDCTE